MVIANVEVIKLQAKLAVDALRQIAKTEPCEYCNGTGVMPPMWPTRCSGCGGPVTPKYDQWKAQQFAKETLAMIDQCGRGHVKYGDPCQQLRAGSGASSVAGADGVGRDSCADDGWRRVVMGDTDQREQLMAEAEEIVSPSAMSCTCESDEGYCSLHGPSLQQQRIDTFPSIFG